MDSNILRELTVVKRSGQRVLFNGPKITIAIKKAFDSVPGPYNEKDVNRVYEDVLNKIIETYNGRKTINVEDIQDIIEKILHASKYHDVYKSFNQYRLMRAASREAFSIKQQHKFVKAIEKVGYTVKQVNNKKPNELLDKFAKTISKEFALSYLIENKTVRALEEGVIYLNDLRNYSFGNTSSCHLNTNINTDSINEYFNKIINIINLCKKDQYREQTLMNFDTSLKTVLIKEYKNKIIYHFFNILKLNGLYDYFDKDLFINTINDSNISDFNNINSIFKNKEVNNMFEFARKTVLLEIEKILQDNFEKLFLILDTCIDNSYKKIIICFDNYDNYENNLIIENYFKVLKRDNKIITNIFINNNIKINRLIADAIISKVIVHLIFENDRNINYFSNGEKIFDNINNHCKTSLGRILNSTITINLSRLALNSFNIKEFFDRLDSVMDLTRNSLIQRYDIQANKYKENYNVLFKNNLIFEANKLEDNQKVRKVIRHGTMFMGYTGIVEAVLILNKKENNEINDDDYKLLIKIIKFMKSKCSSITLNEKLNFELCEVYDTDILKEFIKIDKSVFGLKKSINKDMYEPFYKIINNKRCIKNTIEILGDYQKHTSSITKILINKKTNQNNVLKLIDDLKVSDNKYVSVEVNYGN